MRMLQVVSKRAKRLTPTHIQPTGEKPIILWFKQRGASGARTSTREDHRARPARASQHCILRHNESIEEN